MYRTFPILFLTSLAVAQTPKDLNPVKIGPAPKHDPVPLVEKGKAVGSIAVMQPRCAAAANQMQQFIEEATGVKLPIVQGKITPPAIVLGDCPLAASNGLVGKDMPIEGFAIRTIAGHVLIVGNDADVVPGLVRSLGTDWGAVEFLERFVGVRWYFPGDLGRSVPKAESLVVAPTSLTDAPAFRLREIWPPVSEPWRGSGTNLVPLHTFLRGGNSWPNRLVVHSPDWSKNEDYKKNRPEVFQLRSDGTRDHSMLCYSHPRTLSTYIENIEASLAGKPATIGIFGKAVTVSPADAEIACYAKESRALWDDKGGQYGSASKVVGKFTADLAADLKKRRPDMTVLYLPYLNYTTAPEGIVFPDNVEVQLCGMPGLALYKEPDVAKSEQENIDRWVKLTGRKIQNWHYSCWPEDRTTACYLYPHTVREFYRKNRDKTVGTFINGVADHWPRGHISLYCWLKVLWNPEFDVDAAIEEHCRRMYGPAAATMRELIGMQIDNWENKRLPGGRLSSKGIHEISFPRKTVEKMESLLILARKQAAGDAVALKRVEYHATPFAEFFKESKQFAEGGAFKPLIVQKVGEDPVIDGKLDDAVWKRAQEVPFVMAWDKTAVKYSTTVKAVWTPKGVTFGFRMTEPTPDRLEKGIKGHDDSMLWWDDNIELLFDVTGKNEGEFYHFIVSAGGAVADAKGKDFSWTAKGMKKGVHIGKDFWSLEVFFPYSDFPEAKKPTEGTGITWHGSFTRHRVADQGLKPKFTAHPDSKREYTRMNTTLAKPSNNLADFAPIKFQE